MLDYLRSFCFLPDLEYEWKGIQSGSEFDGHRNSRTNFFHSKLIILKYRFGYEKERKQRKIVIRGRKIKKIIFLEIICTKNIRNCTTLIIYKCLMKRFRNISSCFGNFDFGMLYFWNVKFSV